MRMTKVLFFLLLYTALSIVNPMGRDAYAQCYGSLSLEASYFEFDHLVRMSVHFGDEADIPKDIICCEGMLQQGMPVGVPTFLPAAITR